MKKIITYPLLMLLISGCHDRTLALAEVAARRQELAGKDTTVTTAGTPLGFGVHVPFSNASVRRFADGVDTMMLLAADTAAIGRKVAVRVRVVNAALFGLDFGTVLVADDSNLFPALNQHRKQPR